MTSHERVAGLRKKSGLSQSSLAARVGVTKNTVSVWERNLRKPEFGTLEKLCAFFGVSMSYLLGEGVEGAAATQGWLRGKPIDEERVQGRKDSEEIRGELEAYVEMLVRLSEEERTVILGEIEEAYRRGKFRSDDICPH